MFKSLPENNFSFGETKPTFVDSTTQDVGWSFELLKSNEQLGMANENEQEKFPKSKFP